MEVLISWDDEQGVRPSFTWVNLSDILPMQVDVETKLACALAGPALRQPLMTSHCWPQEIRLDLHDSRQLRWLQQHITVRLQCVVHTYL